MDIRRLLAPSDLTEPLRDQAPMSGRKRRPFSAPRLGFNDFWDCAMLELAPLMPFRRVTGAYWDRDLTHAIEESIADHDRNGSSAVITTRSFTRDQIYTLLDLAVRYPHADAIAPLQTARHHAAPMFTVPATTAISSREWPERTSRAGKCSGRKPRIFGLTLAAGIEAAGDAEALVQPHVRPNGESDKDPDVQFWHNWKAAGNTLYVALRVPVGHCDLMVRWPSLNLRKRCFNSPEFTRTEYPKTFGDSDGKKRKKPIRNASRRKKKSKPRRRKPDARRNSRRPGRPSTPIATAWVATAVGRGSPSESEYPYDWPLRELPRRRDPQPPASLRKILLDRKLAE
jgi:hypothetical protein